MNFIWDEKTSTIAMIATVFVVVFFTVYWSIKKPKK